MSVDCSCFLISQIKSEKFGGIGFTLVLEDICAVQKIVNETLMGYHHITCIEKEDGY